MMTGEKGFWESERIIRQRPVNMWKMEHEKVASHLDILCRNIWQLVWNIWQYLFHRLCCELWAGVSCQYFQTMPHYEILPPIYNTLLSSDQLQNHRWYSLNGFQSVTYTKTMRLTTFSACIIQIEGRSWKFW